MFISDYHVYLRAADAFNHTPDGRALLHSRWRVEPTVAQGQLYQACALRNLLLWLSRIRRGLARRPPP